MNTRNLTGAGIRRVHQPGVPVEETTARLVLDYLVLGLKVEMHYVSQSILILLSLKKSTLLLP